MKKSKLIRITTVPISLKYLIKGQMHYMSKNGFEVTMISANGDEIEDVKNNEECKHIIFPLTRKITPLQDIKTTYKLYKFLKVEKPNIVHTHTPKAGIVGMLASYLAKVPNRFHTVAGLPLLEAKGLKRKVLNFVEKLTYSCATKVYPNSYGLEEIILQNKFTSKNNLKVIANGSSNGIDVSFFDPELYSIKGKEVLRNKLKISKDDFVFIFVGRIVGDKGINELIHAFSKLSNENKNVKLLLVGPFEEELDPLQEQTKEIINNNEQIISVGYKNDVRPYFTIANVLVFPSYREGFPNVVMQAGAMEIPSIVSDINGCNEIIEEGKNGIIIPAKNSTEVYAGMKKLYLDTVYYNLLKSNSRKMIINRYDQSVVWKAILNEYKKSINNV